MVDTANGPLALAPRPRAAAAAKANFDPDQSRLPAGDPDGRQWTDEGDNDEETAGSSEGEGSSDWQDNTAPDAPGHWTGKYGTRSATQFKITPHPSPACCLS